MGGFHLFKRGSERTSDVEPISHEEDIPLHPLAAIDLYGDNTTLNIDFSSFAVPTETEIKDRGKSDWLAKSLVLFQTSWFVMQCLARAVEHLPITHLEIVTLAYAAMNFVIYVFWWNKPLNVNRPVRVFRESEPSETQPQPISEARKLTWEAILIGLGTFAVGTQDDHINLSREDRVPTFWANTDGGDAAIADLIMFGVGIFFGAIHCIAWHFSFPTYAKLLMWRISSVAMTSVPTYIFLVISLTFGLHHMDFKIAGGITTSIFSISIFPAGILYILARAVTLVLAFTSLRGLPPGAFDTVHWTTFIPHI